MSDLPELVRFLPWDSVFFGKRIAQVVPKSLTQSELDLIDVWSMANTIDCLYFLSESLGGDKLSPVQQAGFRLMDLRVTLVHELKNIPTELANDISSVVKATKTDISTLRQMAAVNHRDTRFYSDSHFSRERCDALYSTWIENAANDPQQTVFIYKPEDNALGYATYSADSSKAGEIGLVGVAPSHQGKGIGFLLVNYLLNHLANNQFLQVSVVTQGNNHRALNLYEKAGFRIHKIETWFHKWY